MFISFFDFITDPITNSLHDNHLKTEINKIKGQIQRSDYRTKFAIVLLSNKTSLESPDIEERLANIRRSTGLDPKTALFFLPPNTSQVEIRQFVFHVLSTLQPVCIEYYRDLTKHARRKKTRGTVPPPTAPPTTAELSLGQFAASLAFAGSPVDPVVGFDPPPTVVVCVGKTSCPTLAEMRAVWLLQQLRVSSAGRQQYAPPGPH